MELGTMDALPSGEDMMNMYRLIATEKGGQVTDIIKETASRLGMPMDIVQETVCATLCLQPHKLPSLWIPADIDR